MTDICYIYWVKLDTHTDVFTQGYVGISSNPEYRYRQHHYNSVNKNNWHSYRTEFTEAMKEGKTELKILLKSTRYYCFLVEELLRPDWKIGWNLAKGGKGGIGTHGLTGTAVRRNYYNMLQRARKTNSIVCSEWLGKDGLVNFASFYREIYAKGLVISLIDPSGEYSPNNVAMLSIKDVTRRALRFYDIGDGYLYSIVELSEIYNIKQNTISTRIKRGWTIRQAVGIDSRGGCN